MAGAAAGAMALIIEHLQVSESMPVAHDQIIRNSDQSRRCQIDYGA